MKTIPQDRLETVRKSVAQAAETSGRKPEEITLIGVSKFHPAAAVIEMALAGLRDFGENRVQEAEGKKVEVEAALLELGRDPNQIRWHLVGHLQSNKTAKAAAIFDVIHSIDSIELARKLGEAAVDLDRHIDCLLQVNTSREESKSGVEGLKALEIAEAIAAQPALRFTGLMTIGPLSDDPAQIEASFEELRQLRDEIEAIHPEWGKLDLSMGMTGDYPLAIASGATMIRIGTALFGTRALNKLEGA